MRWFESESQDVWHNLALISIGGLLSSTVLILLACCGRSILGRRTSISGERLSSRLDNGTSSRRGRARQLWRGSRSQDLR